MAIQFLNNVDFNLNQAQEFVLENLSTDPASGQTNGRLIYNTSSNVVKVFNGTAWVEVGGGVTDLTVSGGTYISLTNASAATGSVNLGTVDISAVDGTASAGERYLTKNNTWAEVAAIPGTYDWDIAGDSGTETVASGDTITFAGGTNVTTSYNTTTNTLTINSTDQYTGTVTSVDAGSTTFISGSGGPVTTSGTLSYSLSATGTPSSSTYLRGDNTWAALPADPTITLSGEVTGSGTTSITTTVANNVLDIDNFTAATIVTEAEGIENNDNDTTLPTSAAVKDYVDSAVVGGLVYQGGYNASTNTPDLDGPPSPNNIKKGWTYTVTADGSFFTEQVRVGDVLIAEVDAPTSLADWTTVQNNIDLASLTQVGIGNVNAGTGISVTYNNGTATVSQDGTNQSAKRVDLNSTVTGVTRAEAGGITTFTIDVSDANIFGGSTSALDVMVEVIGNAANAGNTVYAEIGRSASNLTVKFTGSVANGDYQVLLNNVA